MSWTIATGSISTAWGSLTALSLDGLTPVSLKLDYRRPAEFIYEAHPGSHLDLTTYIHKRVTLVYDGVTRFRGRIESVEGSDDASGKYRFTATDFRGNSRNVIVETSPEDTSSGYTPSFPERIYNAPDSDAEYNLNKLNDGTVGEILKDLFDSHSDRLLDEDGIYSSSAIYVQSELDLLDHVPGKMVFKELTFEAAVMKVLQEQGKAWSLFVDPADGVWHFIDRRNASSTINVDVGTDAVVRDNISTSLDGCYTAITLFGRDGAGDAIERDKIGYGYTPDGIDRTGTLVADWDSALESTWTIEKSLGERDSGNVDSHGASGTDYQVTDTSKDWETDFWKDGTISFPHLSETQYTILSNTATQIVFDDGSTSPSISSDEPYLLRLDTDYVWVYRRFYIADTSRRAVVEGGTYGDEDCCPRFFLYGYEDSDPVNGSCLSKILVPIRFEPNSDANGVRILTQYPIYKKTGTVYSLYENFALDYCFRTTDTGTPIKARSPATSYTGTAYTDHGLAREKIMTVPEFTDVDDVSKYQSLAAEVLKPYQDVRAWGSVTVRELYWAIDDLDRMVNIRDAAGTTKIGNTSLVSVLFSFLMDETTLQISNDFRDGFNYDHLLKRFDLDETTRDGELANEGRDDYIFCAKGGSAGNYETGRELSVEANTTTDNVANLNMGSSSLWGWFARDDGMLAGTRCDAVTYNSDGTHQDPNSGACGGVPLFACNYGVYQLSHKFYDPETGASTQAIYGVVLRDGLQARYANTHYLYPYLCKTGSPSSTQGYCSGGVSGTKEVVIIVPDTLNSDEVHFGTFLAAFMRAYVNFIQFTSQGLSCTDDRLFLIDRNVWGDAGGAPASSGCEMSLADSICEMMKIHSKWDGDSISVLHAALVKAAEAKVYTTSAGGTPAHTHTVTLKPVPIDDMPTKPDCAIKGACCPTCGAGYEYNDCCKGSI